MFKVFNFSGRPIFAKSFATYKDATNYANNQGYYDCFFVDKEENVTPASNAHLFYSM